MPLNVYVTSTVSVPVRFKACRGSLAIHPLRKGRRDGRGREKKFSYSSFSPFFADCDLQRKASPCRLTGEREKSCGAKDKKVAKLMAEDCSGIPKEFLGLKKTFMQHQLQWRRRKKSLKDSETVSSVQCFCGLPRLLSRRRRHHHHQRREA